LRTLALPEGADPAEIWRIRKRAKNYTITGGTLYRVMPDGTRRTVPPPPDREQIIRRIHGECGHYGMRRTLHLVLTSYWWAGVRAEVEALVSSCDLCSRARAAPTPEVPQLQPLPVMGLFYRWGVDLAGPFPTSRAGNTYLFVAIEHFSKTLEVTGIPNKEPITTASALLSLVLSRYASPAEVLTDQGREFQGDFSDLLSRCMIDHCTTSAGHPQADGLTERAVQTLKRALRKLVADSADPTNWDVQLHWAALGYRCSVQESTGYSPYYLLYGRHPIIPPAVRERMEEPLVLLQEPEELAKQLTERAALMQQATSMAGQNLLIAQHRDTLRYARVRSGGYTPRLKRFLAGDYVYLRDPTAVTLDLPVKPQILRVVRANDTGVLTLQGRCGTVTKKHVTEVVPCHLPILDTGIDPTLARPAVDLACEVCEFTDREADMLLCDACGTGWHFDCLSPPLPGIPEGDWFCPRCPHGRRALPVPAIGVPERRSPFLTAAQRQRDRFHAEHDGRLVKRPPPSGRGPEQWGIVQYLGRQNKPHVFRVKWQDNSTSDVTWRMLRPMLAPEGTLPPPAVVSVVAAGLPDTFDLSTAAGWHEALAMVMPGDWTPSWLTRLANSIPGGTRFLQRDGQHTPGQPECVVTQPAEVDPLLETIDLSHCLYVFDPWSGTGGVQLALRAQSISVVCNDINVTHDAHYHLDALQPSTYHKVTHVHGRPDAIVCSPWFRVLDLALPLAVMFAGSVACVHVPGHYVTNAHPARLAWLCRLRDAGRLVLLLGLPRGATGRRCIWVVVFKDSSTRRMLMSREPANVLVLA
jgi:transposase InsO family protein